MKLMYILESCLYQLLKEISGSSAATSSTRLYAAGQVGRRWFIRAILLKQLPASAKNADKSIDSVSKH